MRIPHTTMYESGFVLVKKKHQDPLGIDACAGQDYYV